MSEVTSERSLDHNNEEGQGTEAEAEEVEYEGTSEYIIAPLLRRALNEQLSAIMSIIEKAFSQNKYTMPVDTWSLPEKTIIQSVRGRGGRAIRRMLDLLTSKRLANDNTKLVVRLYGIPKLPTKAVITTFLAEFSATSLKKSERSKMYVATLPNYREYDRICKLGSVLIGGFKLQIKPLHLNGPKRKPLKPGFKNQKKNILGSIYESVQPRKNEPPSKNASNVSSSKQDFSMNDAVVLDEFVESDTNYDDEEMQLDDLEDY